MTARSPPSTAYDYAPRARLVSLRAPSRRAGGRITYAPRVNRLRVASRRVDDARSSTIRVTNPRSRRRRVRSPSSRRVASRRVARASRTVVDGLRRHGGADADRHRRAGEIRERVRGGAHGFRSDATRCDDDHFAARRATLARADGRARESVGTPSAVRGRAVRRDERARGGILDVHVLSPASAKASPRPRAVAVATAGGVVVIDEEICVCLLTRRMFGDDRAWITFRPPSFPRRRSRLRTCSPRMRRPRRHRRR